MSFPNPPADSKEGFQRGGLRSLAGTLLVTLGAVTLGSTMGRAEPAAVPAAAASAAPGAVSVGGESLPVIERAYSGVIESLYSKRMPELIRNYPGPQVPPVTEMKGWYWSRGIRTPEDTNYIGVVKRIILNAPIERVYQQNLDFKGYLNVFADTEEVEVVGREPGLARVRFRKKSPTVLVPDIRYTMLYAFDRTRKDRWLIRYQLIEGNSATHTDGLIVMEPLEGGKTLLTAWDFFRANWGVVKTFAEKRIWSETYLGHYRCDIAFRLRAENPELTLAQISERVEKELVESPLPNFQSFDHFMYQ